jgi:hypothetical protein
MASTIVVSFPYKAWRIKLTVPKVGIHLTPDSIKAAFKLQGKVGYSVRLELQVYC